MYVGLDTTKNGVLELKMRKEVKLLCEEVRKVKRKITSMSRADGDREAGVAAEGREGGRRSGR